MTSLEFSYGCIIDAGSSGSRIYLYRWPKAKEGDHIISLAKVEQKAVFSDEIYVGINNAERGIPLLDELVSLTRDALPPHVDTSTVPIYLGATAGMRLSNSEFEAVIMTRIRSMLHASGFLFQDDWARTISGEEESVYGWLVANYLKNGGSFPADSSTYGALDLGGGSTQISLISSSSSLAPIEYQYPLRIGTMNYPLYTRSYLYYGADQARMQYEIKYVTTSSLDNKVNPCYPIGYTNPDTGISGSSNWDECFSSVAKLFISKEHSNLRGRAEEMQNDTFDVTPPPIDVNSQQRFILMSVFVFTWDFIGLKIEEDTDDLDTLKDRAGNICGLTHEEQTKQYDLTMKTKPPRRKTNKPYAQCFNAAFSYHLLSRGYGLPVIQTPIEIYYEIHGSKVQWALGMMLVEANKQDLIENRGGIEVLERKMGTATNLQLMLLLIISLCLIVGRWVRTGRLPYLHRLKPAKHSML